MIVASVRHTGTMFVFEHLLNRQGENYHFGEKFVHKVYDYDGGVIVPLRRLEAIINSWSGRQLDPRDLDAHLEQMIEYVERKSPYLMPIDHPDRQEYLDDINEGFGLSLKTDWPIINSKSHHHCGDDFSRCLRHRPFFDEIYKI